ncbi:MULTISPECIES: hypothetical protein [unclassified Microcoleus]|uniref:hypothetical protein n=1 Tax=unclassified Microcoleus TaxID=2642155 RepID=UPI002FD56C04
MNEVTQDKQKIMLIATHTPNIGIAEELRAIETVTGGSNSKLELDSKYVTSVEEITDLIQFPTPVTRIIHISGEGKTDGTVELPNSYNNKIDRVKAEALAGFFRNATGVKCVILNFCYSSEATRLIAQHIQCVIGVEGYIERTAAVEFSKNFYKYLQEKILNQEFIDQAFSRGTAAAFPRTGDTDTYIKLTGLKPQPEMQIIEPAEGSKVPYPCECRGTFKNLDEGASMWAYVNATIEGKFYLVLISINNYPIHATDGEWQVPLYIGPEQADNHKYRIGVLIVDPETTPKLKSQYDKSLQERPFFALDSLPHGTQAFGDRVVTRQ